MSCFGSLKFDCSVDRDGSCGLGKRRVSSAYSSEINAVFHFNRIVAKRKVFHCEHSLTTNDMDTIEYATFRYGTVEVENGLKQVSHTNYILNFQLDKYDLGVGIQL